MFQISIKKSKKNKFYAMRVVPKENLFNSEMIDSHLEMYIYDRKIGLLGRQCKFLVKTISTFQSKVILNSNC
jgi:hypothetical protein